MQDQNSTLQKALAKVLRKLRQKSISKLSNEVDISKSVWSDTENCKKEILFSTFWKFANALDVRPSYFVALIEEELGEQFSFIEDN